MTLGIKKKRKQKKKTFSLRPFPHSRGKNIFLYRITVLIFDIINISS